MKINRLKLNIPAYLNRSLPYLFSVLILGGIFIPAHQAYAGLWEVLTDPGLAFTSFLVVIGEWILFLVSRLLWVSGHLFDYTLFLTLDNATFSNIDAVYIGWKISRDIVNIFFIFILLYIAIATILQIAGYGIKELLVKVIIIALLVNFSLVITKVVIDASNVLAMEFYSQIGFDNNGDGRADKPDITSVMMQGLSLSTIYDGKNLKDPQNNGKEAISSGTVIVGTLGGSALILVTTFVFFAATILFIVRTVFLLFLMILSPLAFMAMILPSTKSHASKWWSSLFNQAFFAPAFMFMIYLVARIINDKTFSAVISNRVGADASASISSALSGSEPNALGVLVKFIILIGLMIGSLIVASKMGAVGSSTVMKWGDTARKWGQGYAGRMTKRGAGFVAEKTLDEKSWINQKTGGNISGAMRRIPLAARGAAYASSWREQQLKAKKSKYEKKYGSYSNAGLEAMQESTDSLRSSTLDALGMKDVRGKAAKEAHDKREGKKEADKRKEKNIEKEDKEYKVRKDRVEKPSNPWAGKDPVDLKKEIANINAEISSLENVSPESIKNDPSLQDVQNDIKKKRAELTAKKVDIELEQEDRERMRQIEEIKERRIETEKIEERVSKVEGASSGKSEKKEKPTS